jgi:pentatricopeptide repeat protein
MQEGEAEKAMNLLNKMISKGHQANVVTYNTLINELCKKREFEKTMNFLDYMISKRLQPDVMTYTHTWALHNW